MPCGAVHSGAACAGSNSAGGAARDTFSNIQPDASVVLAQGCDLRRRKQDQVRAPHARPRTAPRAKTRRSAPSGRTATQAVCMPRRAHGDHARQPTRRTESRTGRRLSGPDQASTERGSSRMHVPGEDHHPTPTVPRPAGKPADLAEPRGPDSHQARVAVRGRRQRRQTRRRLRRTGPEPGHRHDCDPQGR